jgi:FKBP-type peptidyl-prolyl cis-trans isomerase 2
MAGSKNPKKSDAQTAKKGDIVKVEYEGSLEDGTIFDCTEKHNGQPLEFEAGCGRMIKGFDEAVLGMRAGESKTVKLAPEQAYGRFNPLLVQKVPREHLPKEPEPKPGMMIVMSLPTGEQIPARITDVSKDAVTMDFNHPLTGKTLIFKIKVVEIQEKKG